MRNQLKNRHFYYMMAGDAFIFMFAHILSYIIRFEFTLDAAEAKNCLMVLPWLVPLKVAVFYIFGLYRGMWRYTSIRDFWALGRACIVSTLLIMAVVLFVYRFHGISRAVYLLDGGVTFLLAGGLRMAIRLHFAKKERLQAANGQSVFEIRPKRTLIVGAGAAGEKILREIFDNYTLHYEVAGFIDDDLRKHGRSIHGVSVLGDVRKIAQIVSERNIEEVLIAVPSATGEQMRKIVDACKKCGVFYKTLPGIGEIIDGRVSVKILRDVRYEDLLGRPPVDLDTPGIKNYLGGKTVMITGCGGSIGSELCRQVIKYQPEKLIMVDANEANLFLIQMELQHELHYASFHAVLGHIQDEPLMRSVFQSFAPHVVFHAAAYKHVPLLEKNPWEAVNNNVRGSQTIMELSVEFGVDRFVLVSTDKAVRPTNVMGASKRVTELLLQALQGNGTRFMAVRFGNVVGSSGSVIPLFRRQIEQGGPVTVTHPEVNRFFMTIPEASQLILQAGAMGKGGEIFILEMGTPVKIIDLARDLIRLSGKEPDRDIKIVFTGLREGEKLYEELITSGEDIVPTRHEKIMVLRPDGSGANHPEEIKERLKADLEALYEAALRHDSPAIKKKLKTLVPEYNPQESQTVLE